MNTGNIKKNIIIGLCTAAFATMAFTSLGIKVSAEKKQEVEMQQLLDKSDYKDLNDAYRLEQIDSLLEMLKKGEISEADFIAKAQEIEDYDKYNYIINSKAISKTEIKNYDKTVENTKRTQSITNITTAIGGFGALGTLVAVELCDSIKIAKKKKEQENSIEATKA